MAVIGGGANLGTWAAGFFAPLNEARVPISAFGGASVGAVFAPWWAKHWGEPGAGDRLLPICTGFAEGRPPRSLMGLADRLQGTLVAEFGQDRLEDLPMEVVLSARNTVLHRTEFLSQGSVVDGVMASAALPFVFPTRRIDGQRYGDGAVANYAGVKTAEHFAMPFDQMIVVDLSNQKTPPSEQPSRARDIVDMLTAGMYELAALQVENFKLKNPDVRVLHLRPDLPAIRVGDFSFTKALFEDGKRFGGEALERHFDARGRLRDGALVETPADGARRPIHETVDREMARRHERMTRPWTRVDLGSLAGLSPLGTGWRRRWTGRHIAAGRGLPSGRLDEPERPAATVADRTQVDAIEL